MATTSELKILVTAQNQASAVLGQVQSSVGNLNQHIENLQPTFQRMATIGTATFAGIAGVVGLSVNAYADAERAQRQLEHAVIGVSKGTKEQAEAVSTLTDALQAKAGIDGDALKMGVAQLSTFGLQSDTVVKLTKSLADLTVNQNGVNASSDQYIQSANVIAKALNGQFGALEKSGIRFTEAQQNMILYGTESQKTSALMEGLNQNLRETTDTLSGVDVSVARAQRSMGEMQESFGKLFAPMLEQLSLALTPVINSMTEWITKNPELAKTITLVVAGLAGVVAIAGTLGLILPAITAGFGALATAVAFLASPIGLVIVAVGALIAVGWLLYQNWDKIVGALKLLWEGMKNAWNAVIDWISDKMLAGVGVITGAWQAFKDFFIGIWDGIKSAINDAWNYISGIVDSIVNAVSRAISAVKSIGGGIISGAVSAVTSVANFAGFRADGGPVTAGKTYMVGERGAEFFTPSSSGFITPAGAGGVTININNPTVLNEQGARDLVDITLSAFGRSHLYGM